MGSWGPKISSCGQRRLWSDWADVQADLSLRWAHTHFVGFVMSRHKFKDEHENSVSLREFYHISASSWENVSSGVSYQVRLRLACSATEASMRFDIFGTETRYITLSRQRTTRALIRLRGGTGWSASLLFAYDIRHVFSWLICMLTWQLQSYACCMELDARMCLLDPKCSLMIKELSNSVYLFPFQPDMQHQLLS